MQFIKRWIYWHNFELGFIVNIDLWIVFCDKFWSADLMAHTPTHEWQVSLQSTYTWILYMLWTLLSYVKINIEYPVNPSCFQVLPPSLYTKLSTSSRRTLVVTTARIRPHFCVIHINIISLHKLTHCVRDNTSYLDHVRNIALSCPVDVVASVFVLDVVMNLVYESVRISSVPATTWASKCYCKILARCHRSGNLSNGWISLITICQVTRPGDSSLVEKSTIGHRLGLDYCCILRLL